MLTHSNRAIYRFGTELQIRKSYGEFSRTCGPIHNLTQSSFRINSRQGSPSDEVEVGGGIPGAQMGPSPPAMNAAAAAVAQQQAALQALQAQQLLHPEGNFPVSIFLIEAS